MPFVDVAGSEGTPAPAQMVSDAPKLNVGTVFEFTLTVKVVDTAHCPAEGVNVYVPEFWLSTVAGLHVPAIPLADVEGNEGTVPPAQMDSVVPKLNVGVTIGFTVTVKVVVTAHCPAPGVNV
jgi:hypothetical protein